MNQNTVPVTMDLYTKHAHLTNAYYANHKSILLQYPASISIRATLKTDLLVLPDPTHPDTNETRHRANAAKVLGKRVKQYW